MGAIETFTGLLAPALCPACGREAGRAKLLCERCVAELARLPAPACSAPPGLVAAWASAAHEGVARDLVVALKFRRLLSVARVIAERILHLAPADLLEGELVPVPAAPLRGRMRGFDPAAEIALALRAASGLPVCECLRRRGGRRQLGRDRRERLGDPPRIEAAGPPPARAVLVDDVWTTGATLASCATALRGAGSQRVTALVFARRV
ncbi:MAG: hypothetical protein U0R52_08970 [Solirubrobacterales bacterium]